MRFLQGVEGVLIAGNDGQIHKTTLSEQMTQEYASQIPSLAALARNVVRDLDAQVSIHAGAACQQQHANQDFRQVPEHLGNSASKNLA
jgi:hypothetical protein